MNLTTQIAQTNIQLYRQLIVEGYSRSDIRRVRDTYELATTLFSGQFRGCGKTFIAHLVGVASVQTSLGCPVEQIQAGLLHSVYTFGDFGGVPPGFTEKKRARLRESIGQEAEKLLYAFHKLDWDEDSIQALLQHETMYANDLERSVILMRLAHEIEEHADWSFLFDEKYDRLEVARRLSLIITIAERLQEMQLAEYARLMAADVQQATPDMHFGHGRAGRVYTIIPNSSRLRYTPRRIYRTLKYGITRAR